MRISSFYNREEKALIISTAKAFKETKSEKNSLEQYDEIKIYNEQNELIGVNLLGYQNDKINTGIVNNEVIMDIIKKYFDEEILFPYVVGKVIEIEKHPKSEKLNICQVSIGEETTQIVCGAKNVTSGIKVIVSMIGAVMPNGMVIKPSKLIDVESNGMITSLFELGLSTDGTQGIAILDDNLEEGIPYYG